MGGLQTALLVCAIAVFATSEALALLHPDPRVNSLLQYIRSLDIRRGRWVVAAIYSAGLAFLFVFAQHGTARPLPSPKTTGIPRQLTEARCSLEGISKRSFVGTWLGREAILYVSSVQPTVVGASFEYDLRLGSARIRGNGSIDGRTCEVDLGSFDSRGRLVHQGAQIAFESVEPAWRLVASRRVGVPP